MFNKVTPANIAGYLAGTTIAEAGCSKTPSATRLDSICSEGAKPYSDESYGNLLRAELDLGGATLRTSTAARWWKNIQTGTDLDGLGSINGHKLTSASTLNGMPAGLLSFIPTIGPAFAPFVAAAPIPTGTVSLFQTDNSRKQRAELLC